MQWWQFASFGAFGGVLVEALSLFKWYSIWQNARRTASGTIRNNPPPLKRYVDVKVQIGMLIIRAVLGAASAAIFAMNNQLKGAFVAIALGFCGPALLNRLGEIPQVTSIVAGRAPTPDQSADGK